MLNPGRDLEIKKSRETREVTYSQTSTIVYPAQITVCVESCYLTGDLL